MPKKISTTKTKKPKYVTKTVKSYDPWISVQKFFIQATLVALVAFLTYFVDTAIPGLILEYPQYMAILAIVTSIITFAINWVKNHNNTIEVKVNSETGEIVEYHR